MFPKGKNLLFFFLTLLPHEWASQLLGLEVYPSKNQGITFCFPRFFGTKWMLFLSVGIYALFVSTNYWERYYTLVPSAVAIGAAIVPLWASMSNYITRWASSSGALRKALAGTWTRSWLLGHWKDGEGCRGSNFVHSIYCFFPIYSWYLARKKTIFECISHSVHNACQSHTIFNSLITSYQDNAFLAVTKD